MRKTLNALVLSCAIAIGLPATSFGQDNRGEEPAPNDAILVLDASGSMWGQIDGVNKIVIAKDVVEGLVRSLSASQRLGMVAYGHRKKGDCSDIQTIADVGANRDAVVQEIRALSPKGMTPLTKSVEHAAKELNYTKNAATVILVSDGLETCEADPCALARTLEENGLDFTVHVVGFDVTEEERKGLACIAEETGGQFLAADNADELTDALTQVALVAEPAEPLATDPSAPRPQTVALRATLLKGGPQIQSNLNWSVANAATGEVVFEMDDTGFADFEVVPGDYRATAVWTGWPHESERVAGDKTGTKDFTIIAARPAVVSVPIDLGIPVTLSADESVAEGTKIAVSWTGPDDLGAVISVNRVDDGPRDAIYFSPAQRARDSYEAAQAKEGKSASDLDTSGDGKFNQDDEASVEIGAPSLNGDYEVRYTLNSPRLILMRVPLTVTDGDYTLNAPDEVPASTSFEVDWGGAWTHDDMIGIEKPDLESAYWQGAKVKLTEGEPANIVAPSEPGEYEIRYILVNGYTTYDGMQHAVQARRPITVTAVDASVSGPAEIIGGSMIKVDVVPVPGDDWKDDYISLVEVGAAKSNRDSWQVMSKGADDGSSIEFQTPNMAGDYEIAYFLKPGDKVLARQPIKVIQAEASLDAPATVKVGQDLEASYTGPAYRGDRVVLVPAAKSPTVMFNATGAYGFFIKQGETSGTGTVRGDRVVTTPGDFELRYTTGHQHVVLATVPVKVVE